MQTRSIGDYVMLAIVAVIAAFMYRQFFPKVETVEHTTVKWLHDTTVVHLPEVHYVVRTRVDTLIVPGKIPEITMSADTTFPDSAHLLVVAYLPPIGVIDMKYQPAPARVITLEKIVEHEVVRTEIKPDIAWTIGGVAVGVIGGIWIAHQIGK